ncbi:MAG: fumarate reductase subunit D [Armatimonadetes bacterium]|nr:fumarate reductase subunit D [Armatimonadota bacterium]
MAHASRSEPFWWSLFAAGGVVAAFLVPIHVLLEGIVGPLGGPTPAADYDRMHAWLASPFTRVYLFVLISLPLFHWAHRFRFTLADLGLSRFGAWLAVLCYGAAIVGTALAAWLLITAP